MRYSTCNQMRVRGVRHEQGGIKMRASVPVTVLLAGAAPTCPLPLSGQSRVQVIAAAFTKRKYVVRETHGARREKYKDVRSEPTVRPNIGDYAGVYAVAE